MQSIVVDWRSLLLSGLNIEITDVRVLSFNSKYKMPPKAGQLTSAGEAKAARGSVTTRASLELPVSAVAGLQGEDAEKFEEYADICERACPSIHCWTPTGEVLIGCSTGELLKVIVIIILHVSHQPFYSPFTFQHFRSWPEL